MAYLALDIGAGSGRGIIGEIKNGVISLHEIHRFGNKQVQLGDTLYWDFPALFFEIKKCISIAVRQGYKIESIAVDTWGVDFGLLDTDGHLLSNPVCYRDKRTQKTLPEAYKLLSKERLYELTGIQLMGINSAFQLLAMKNINSAQLSVASKLLFIPDLINHFLTGNTANEYTIASTSQLLDAKSRNWSSEIFDALKLPVSVMQKVIFPGELIGRLTTEIALETGASIDTEVIAVGSHDTASAVGAIPASDSNWAFLSSGTWSLLGIELNNPILTVDSMNSDFTNEGGVDDKILYMRNITGLWLLQCLMQEWEKEDGKACDYTYLLSLADKALPFRCIVNSDDATFIKPTSAKQAIIDYCKNTKQDSPTNKGEFVRCVIESLALKYRFVTEKLKQLSGRQINTLHVVGGGSQINMLNQYTANALDVNVITGPTEATAYGSIIQQAIAKGELSSISEARKMMVNSVDTTLYTPKDIEEWNKVSQKVKHLFQ